MRDFTLTLGLFLLALGLRSYPGLWARRCGLWCMLGATYLAGWHLTGGDAWTSCMGVLMWLGLPWLQVAGPVLATRVPVRGALESVDAQGDDQRDALGLFTRAVNRNGFEWLGDLRWQDGRAGEFERVFRNPVGTVVKVTVQELRGRTMTAVDVVTWTKWGGVYSTGSDGLGGGLRPVPRHCRHVRCGFATCETMVREHISMLEKCGVRPGEVRHLDLDQVRVALESEAEERVMFNLARGILVPSTRFTCRFTVRGFLYAGWRRMLCLLMWP